MPPKRARDRLSMDMATDLQRVDGVMTRILDDRSIWERFVRDPNGVFVELGLHPPTSPDINTRVNDIFYATLTNRRLLRLLLRHYATFRPSRKKYAKTYVDGLKSGRLQHDLELDLEAVDHLVGDTDVFRQSCRIVLHDLNAKNLLQEHHRPGVINDYIEDVIAATQARRPVVEHPRLEGWDQNYGIGSPVGALMLEVATPVTVLGAAEVLITVTVDIDIEVNVPTATASDSFVEAGSAAEGDPLPPIGILLAAARRGDPDSIRAMALLGRLADLTGEILVHAHNLRGRHDG